MNRTTALADATSDNIARELAGATLTVYSVARPASADLPVERSIALATFTFATPAFEANGTPLFAANPVSASHVGTPGFARATRPDGSTIADFSAGPGDREVKFAEVSFSAGAPVWITSFVLKEEETWPERRDYYGTRPRSGFPLPAA